MGDSHSSDDEFCYRDGATNVTPVKSPPTVSLNSKCCDAVLDTPSHSDRTNQVEQASPPVHIEHNYRPDWQNPEEKDQPSALLDCVPTGADIDMSHTEKHGKVHSPSSCSNAVMETDFNAVISSSCYSASMSHSSPDSGVYSKAISNSLITSQSVATESLDVTTDLFKSVDHDRSLDLKPLARLDSRIGDTGSPGNDLQNRAVCETLPEVAQSVSLDDDSDDADTMVDVRSSIMSVRTDDDFNRTLVGTDWEMPDGLFRAHATSATHVEHGDGQSEVKDVCIPADKHVSCLGSQELLGPSDSDAEDDTVLKTVVAVRTKSAVRAEECADLIKPLESHEDLDDVKLQNNSESMHPNQAGSHDKSALEEAVLCGSPEMDNSLSECGQPGAREKPANNFRAQSAADLEGVVVDLTDDRKHAESTPGASEQLSDLSAEVGHYMTEPDPHMDTSFDNHTHDIAAEDTQHPMGLMATVKIFSEDEDRRVNHSGRNSRSRTRSFTKGNSSVPSSRSCSPEFMDRSEIRRHSCTLSSPQPLDTVEQLAILSLEGKEVGNGNGTDSESPLTDSMVDLKIRPSKKKLQFDDLLPDSSQLFVLEPPAEYRDEPVSTENMGSFMPANVIGCRTDMAQPPADPNMQAKQDHLQRYLKSLATMPRCDSQCDVLESCVYQDSKLYSQDVSYNCGFNREDSLQLPYHEHSTLLSVPELLHQSDAVKNFGEDEYLELQLEQYEVMKRQLMEEHRRSLELLLLEQERQMSLLKSRVMGQSLHSEGLHSTRTTTQVPTADTLVGGGYEYSKGKPLSPNVPNVHDRQDLTNKMQIPSHAADLQNMSIPDHSFGDDYERSKGKLLSPNVLNVHDRQNFIDEVQIPSHMADLQNISVPNQSLGGSDIPDVSSGHKHQSPAGVFYSDRQLVSRQPSCSTIRSDDTESEFAYESPAVLRSARRLTPVCSPPDIAKMQVDRSYHNPMPTQGSHPQSSTTLDHSVMCDHRPNRRYVNVFTEASVNDFNVLVVFLVYLFTPYCW